MEGRQPANARDPRAAGDDLPRRTSAAEGPQAEDDRQPLQLPPPGLTEEELNERYGPPAPEPKWTPMERPFNRERFLLWFLAASMAAQYAFLMVGTVLCFRNSRYRLDRKLPPLTAEQNVGCIRIGDRLSTVFELTTATTLALLGGSALAAAAADARTAQRRDL